MNWNPRNGFPDGTQTHNSLSGSVDVSGICLNLKCNYAKVSSRIHRDGKFRHCDHCKSENVLWIEKTTKFEEISDAIAHVISSFLIVHESGKGYDFVSKPTVDGQTYFSVRNDIRRKLSKIAMSDHLCNFKLILDGKQVPGIQSHVHQLGVCMDYWRTNVVLRAFEIAKQMKFVGVTEPEDPMEAYWEQEDRFYDEWENPHEDMRPRSKVLVRNEAGEPLYWDWV